MDYIAAGISDTHSSYSFKVLDIIINRVNI